jgi:dienelactone hydrolase
MLDSDRSAWAPLIPTLHDAGFAILAPDLRGHGLSATTDTRDRRTRRDPRLLLEMQKDLHAAYAWLARQPHIDRARFALVGAELGASIALQYAAKDRSVDAVICLSPNLNLLGLDAAGDIGQITGRRLLLIADQRERDAAYTLRKRAGRLAKVEIYQRRQAHGTEMLRRIPRLEKRIADFLRQNVGSPSTTVVLGSVNSNVYHQADSGWIQRITPANLRYYSSPAEAESRGLRASRSTGPNAPPPRGRGCPR